MCICGGAGCWRSKQLLTDTMKPSRVQLQDIDRLSGAFLPCQVTLKQLKVFVTNMAHS